MSPSCRQSRTGLVEYVAEQTDRMVAEKGLLLTRSRDEICVEGQCSCYLFVAEEQKLGRPLAELVGQDECEAGRYPRANRKVRHSLPWTCRQNFVKNVGRKVFAAAAPADS